MKPSIKKALYLISFACLAASAVALIATIRFSYMTDTDIAEKICITAVCISLILVLYLRRYKGEWTASHSDKSNP